jgi:hypothetical protein
MAGNNKKLTLDQPVIYNVRVQGCLDKSWLEWSTAINISVDSRADGLTVTTITAQVDQAALQGLLRRLYTLGLPLVGISCENTG